MTMANHFSFRRMENLSGISAYNGDLMRRGTYWIILSDTFN